MTQSCESRFVRNNIIQEIRDRKIHRNMKVWNTLDCVSTAADHRSRCNNSTDGRQSQISERKSKDSNRSEQNRIPTGTAREGVATGEMTFSYSPPDHTPRVGVSKAGAPPPRAPSCRPHSAQSQLARARAVRLVTGPHARTPRINSQWVVGPGHTLERTTGRRWESARPRMPHTQAGGAPPGNPHAAPTARKASTQERALWGW